MKARMLPTLAQATWQVFCREEENDSSFPAAPSLALISHPLLSFPGPFTSRLQTPDYSETLLHINKDSSDQTCLTLCKKIGKSPGNNRLRGADSREQMRVIPRPSLFRKGAQWRRKSAAIDWAPGRMPRGATGCRQSSPFLSTEKGNVSEKCSELRIRSLRALI